MREFNLITYNEGDVVIRKNKAVNIYGVTPKPERVYKTQTVEAEGYTYQVLFFESNPSSFNVAWEFEPYDEVQRKQYYELLNTAKVANKSQVKNKKSSPKNTTSSRQKDFDSIIEKIMGNKNEP